MRAVLGILLAGGGLLLGYAVLSGKFPPASAASSSNSNSSSASSSGLAGGILGASTGLVPLGSQTVLTPSQTGLPTMLALSSNDVAASSGGMQ